MWWRTASVTVRAPDAAFIRQDRMPQPIPDRYLPLAPDLVVKVVSPSDSAQQIRARVLDFLSAGTQAVWVIYPGAQTVDVYRPGHDTQIVGPAATRDGGDVLPGFALPLRDLFNLVNLVATLPPSAYPRPAVTARSPVEPVR